MRISDWSSDVCSSDLLWSFGRFPALFPLRRCPCPGVERHDSRRARRMDARGYRGDGRNSLAATSRGRLSGFMRFIAAACAIFATLLAANAVLGQDLPAPAPVVEGAPDRTPVLLSADQIGRAHV